MKKNVRLKSNDEKSKSKRETKSLRKRNEVNDMETKLLRKRNEVLEAENEELHAKLNFVGALRVLRNHQP